MIMAAEARASSKRIALMDAFVDECTIDLIRNLGCLQLRV
jgi:hypothetical protein